MKKNVIKVTRWFYTTVYSDGIVDIDEGYTKVEAAQDRSVNKMTYAVGPLTKVSFVLPLPKERKK